MGGRGSGGHNRKSAAVKKAEGNRGKRKRAATKAAQRAPLGAPEMPRKLGRHATAAWNRLVPVLLERGVLRKNHGDALAALCSATEQLILAEAAIHKYGLICATIDEETSVAVLKANPAVRIKSDALRHVRGLLSSFGLDPASESRLHLPTDDQPSDPLENIRRAKTASDVVQ